MRQRARSCCEYCLIPEALVSLHEPDHIIAVQHRGATSLENLALACWRCNRYKGTNLASVDPKTGQREFLFDPRNAVWAEHFNSEGGKIVGISAVGRVTVALLRFNNNDRVEVRERLIAEGKFPG